MPRNPTRAFYESGLWRRDRNQKKYFKTEHKKTMADFLGNILGSMAGPPKASDKEIAERKKARELAKKIEMRNKQESKEFRSEIDKRIDAFLKLPIGDENRRMVFEPMPKGNENKYFNLVNICIQ